MKSKKKPLDPIVKMGIAILIGGFGLIAFGMFLSRPDRTIPPYSIGTQEGTIVAIHLPPWTSDPEIESLIRRFGKVGLTTRDFGPMKIRPTTPKDPKGRYQTLEVIIFSDPSWAEPDTFHRYVTEQSSESSEEEFRDALERAVRGGYRIDSEGHAGWIGPWTKVPTRDRTLTVQWVFQETWKEGLGVPSSGENPT